MLGQGLNLVYGAIVDLKRVLIMNNMDAGIMIDGTNNLIEDETILNIDDLNLKDTKSIENYYINGIGIGIQKGAILNLNRANIEKNREVGLFIIDNSSANIENVLISNTKVAECSQLSPESEFFCPGFEAGFGLVVVENSKVNFNNLIVDNNSSVGIQIVRKSMIYGQNLKVANHPIGFNIQQIPEDYVLLDGIKGLVMYNNFVNFDSQELQVPSVIDF